MAPLLFATLAALRSSSRPHPTGDHAAIELYTREATVGRQLVGPYSRYGFHHPGPAFFYAAAPLYLASGERYAGIQATAALLGVAAVLAMIACVCLGAGPEAAWAAALAVSVSIHVRGAGSFVSAWNPNVATLAFGAFLFALARIAAGRLGALPLAIASGSLAVQSHVGCTPAVLALGAMAAATLPFPGLRRRAGLPQPEHVSARAAAASGVLLAVLWAPTVLDALAPDRGNLGALVAFLAAAGEGHPLSEATAVVGGQLVAPGARNQGVPIAVGMVLAALGAAVAARRRSAPVTLALAALCAVGTAVAALSATRAEGTLHPYLVRWSSMLGVGVTTAVLHVLLLRVSREHRLGPRVLRRLAVLGAIALASLALASASRLVPESDDGEEQPELQSQRVQRLADGLQAALRERGLRRPRIVVGSAVARPLALGLLLELDKRGASFAAEPFSVVRFPPAWRSVGEDATLILDRTGHSGHPRGEVLLRDGPYRLELISRPAGAQSPGRPEAP